METPVLKDFSVLVPTCLSTSSVASILEIFAWGDRDQIIAIDEQQRPIGVVHLPQFVSYLLAGGSRQPSPQTLAGILETQPANWGQSIFPLIEPVTIIPADWSVADFQAHLLSSGSSSARILPQHLLRDCVLVQAEGKLVGGLDSRSLLTWLAGESALRNSTPSPISSEFPNPHPDSCPDREGYSPRVREETGFSSNLSLELLESLPIPLMVQTSAGEILAQNSAWRSWVGQFPDGDRLSLSSADFLDSIPQLNVIRSGELTQFPPLVQGVREKLWQFFKIPLSNLSLPIAFKLGISKWSQPQASLADRTPELLTIPGMNTQPLTPKNLSYGISPPVIGNPSVWLVFALQNAPHEPYPVLSDPASDLEASGFPMREELLASIAHELKTPLTALLGLSSLLKDELVKVESLRQANYARLIHQSGRQLMATINDLVDWSRLEANELELISQPIRTLDLCDRVCRHIQEALTGSDSTLSPQTEILPPYPITVDIEPGLPLITGDELRLRQILVSLLANAINSTPEGSAPVGLRVRRWTSQWIGFTVWDTGIGIRAEDQPGIFDQFQQRDRLLSHRLDCTGLSLILAQRLAQLHGGDLSFLSSEGQGSEFTLLLPAPPPSEFYKKRPRSPFLALIVDTDPPAIAELETAIRGLNTLCLVARSPQEALDKARLFQPSAIFINVSQPNLDGQNLLLQLQTDPLVRHLRIFRVEASQNPKRFQLADANAPPSPPSEQGSLNRSTDLQTLKHQLDCLLTQSPPVAPPGSSRLTILCIAPLSPPVQGSVANLETEDQPLSPATPSVQHPANQAISSLFAWNSSALPGHEHRLIEADDLDQAELLARIWKPHVLLLNDAGLSDPLTWFQELSQRSPLATLPLVTLTQATTQAANQFPSLTVFPCLAPSGSLLGATTLLQVIQVAAGLGKQESG